MFIILLVVVASYGGIKMLRKGRAGFDRVQEVAPVVYNGGAIELALLVVQWCAIVWTFIVNACSASS